MKATQFWDYLENSDVRIQSEAQLGVELQKYIDSRLVSEIESVKMDTLALWRQNYRINTEGDFERYLSRHGSHYWSNDTKRFFNAKWHDCWQEGHILFFIDSTRRPNAAREYHVKTLSLRSINIEKMGDYKTLRQAQSAFTKLWRAAKAKDGAE
jgi:hypothetical protein